MSADSVFAIMAMALVTYGTRISGMLLGMHIPRTGRLKQALDALPAAVLTAIILPLVAAGPAEMIAGLATVLAATRLPMLGAIAVGIACAALLRGLFG